MNKLYMSGFPDAKSTFEWLKLTGNENYCFYGDRKGYRDSLLEKLLLILVLLLAMLISDEQGVIIERSEFIILGLVIFLPIYSQFCETRKLPEFMQMVESVYTGEYWLKKPRNIPFLIVVAILSVIVFFV